MLQCVAVCCSVLLCVAVCCSVLQCVAVCCSVLQCVAVCCSVLQCVAVCCSVLLRVAVCCIVLHTSLIRLLVFVCVCVCNTLQHTATHAAHCSTLQHTATRCNTLQHAATHAMHCNTLQHMQHTAKHCNTLPHTATHCNTHYLYTQAPNHPRTTRRGHSTHHAASPLSNASASTLSHSPLNTRANQRLFAQRFRAANSRQKSFLSPTCVCRHHSKSASHLTQPQSPLNTHTAP